MLRIQVETDSGCARIRLEGKLIGPWVQELERCWQCLLDRACLPTVVELHELTFIDSEGELLLTAMHESGTRLEARGALSRFIADRIQNSHDPVGSGVSSKKVIGGGV